MILLIWALRPAYSSFEANSFYMHQRLLEVFHLGSLIREEWNAFLLSVLDVLDAKK